MSRPLALVSSYDFGTLEGFQEFVEADKDLVLCLVCFVEQRDLLLDIKQTLVFGVAADDQLGAFAQGTPKGASKLEQHDRTQRCFIEPESNRVGLAESLIFPGDLLVGCLGVFHIENFAAGIPDDCRDFPVFLGVFDDLLLPVGTFGDTAAKEHFVVGFLRLGWQRFVGTDLVDVCLYRKLVDWLRGGLRDGLRRVYVKFGFAHVSKYKQIKVSLLCVRFSIVYRTCCMYFG